MKKTKYFSGVLKNQGVPNLNAEQFANLMNIVSLESRLQELLDIKESNKNKEDYYKYDFRINKIASIIQGLTLDESSDDVLLKMIKKSK